MLQPGAGFLDPLPKGTNEGKKEEEERERERNKRWEEGEGEKGGDDDDNVREGQRRYTITATNTQGTCAGDTRVYPSPGFDAFQRPPKSILRLRLALGRAPVLGAGSSSRQQIHKTHSKRAGARDRNLFRYDCRALCQTQR